MWQASGTNRFHKAHSDSRMAKHILIICLVKHLIGFLTLLDGLSYLLVNELVEKHGQECSNNWEW